MTPRDPHKPMSWQRPKPGHNVMDMALSRDEFGRRFRAARERASLTQQAIADQLDVPWRHVQRWDSGKVLPRAERIPQLAEILGVDVTYLQEPVDENIIDRTARVAQENAVALRTALSLLDELLREVRQNRDALAQAEANVAGRLEDLETRQAAAETTLSQVQEDFLQALGADVPSPATTDAEQATTRKSTTTPGTTP